MSSTTTQILFNSPALHSLKRDQLVKLCKIHSIKASGKTVELVERLKHHAQTLPKAIPLGVAPPGGDIADSETEVNQESMNDGDDSRPPRLSEPWEIVMESIQELDESSSQGTLSSSRTIGGYSQGEFGTAVSKATSVGSSIKALATSLGLKRSAEVKLTTSTSAAPKLASHSGQSSTNSTDELTRHAVPYSSLPPSDPSSLPQTDLFTSKGTSSDPEPIPGHALRPGRPAPPDARLSVGLAATPGKTTTIRLVTVPQPRTIDPPSTPQLRPLATSFDLDMVSPTAEMKVWPQVDAIMGVAKALPPLGVLVGDAAHTQREGAPPCTPGKSLTQKPLPIPNTFTSEPVQESSNPAPAIPFIFGSPLPQHQLSNEQFRNAATSVLEEMNKRLAGEGIANLGVDILDRAKRANGGLNLGNGVSLNKRGGRHIGEEFDRMHEQEFSKMESIASYAAKRESPTKKRKSTAVEQGNTGGAKRRTSTVPASATKVISHGRKKAIMPGGLEMEDDGDNGEDHCDREHKRPRVEGHSAHEKNKVSIALPPRKDDEINDTEGDSKRKEREAIRRKLDMNKARRRSSMGRPSIGKAPVAQKEKNRFGFLSSAKSMVQNVWSKGVTLSKPAISAAPASKLAPKPLATMGPPPLKPTAPVSTRAVGASVSSKNGGTSSTKPISRTESASSLLKPTGVIKSTASSRARSPIPSFTRSSTRNVAGTVNSSKTGSVKDAPASLTRTASSKVSSRTGSATDASSVGTRSSTNPSRVSSMGTRTSVTSISSGDAGNVGVKRGAAEKTNGTLTRTASSRLMAPTANSLARTLSHTNAGALQSSTSQHVGKPLPAVIEDRTVIALDQVHTSASSGHLAPSTTPDAILSKPLTDSSSIPTPATNGANLMTKSTVTTKPAEALKLKILPKRKPRISRSRVISQLASQRAALDANTAGTGGGSAGPGKGTSAVGRIRSSLGTAKRQSVGTKGENKASGVIMSSKKRARQSEYARRKSRTPAEGVL